MTRLSLVFATLVFQCVICIATETVDVVPHRENLWQILYNEGIDLINADDLPRLQKFLQSQSDCKPTNK